MVKVFARAFNNIRRHAGLTAASVIMMTTTFTVISIFGVAAWGSNVVLKNLESKAEVTAFFKKEVDENSVLAIKKSLEDSGKVLGVQYTSKDEAFKSYQEQHKDEPAILENITAKIFPSSLAIQARDLNDLPMISSELQKQPQVDEVIFFKDVVATFQSWVKTIRIGGLSLIGFLGLVSMLIVFLTLGISIHNSASEIEILKLIGAPKRYVSYPFIIQGMIYGLVSAIITSIILGIAIPLGIPKISYIFSGITFPQISYQMIGIAIAAELIMGTVLGAFGSVVAVGRYLKY